ncbi:hypothetical protein O181_119946, partial [Austropuccinia psidii MF-1]|nr:hypothetical protein [Austropuccinia psidii MF-1]
MIWIHVEDVIVAKEDKGLLQELHHELGEMFRLKWEDSISSIICVEILTMTDRYKLSQQKLIESIVESAWDGRNSTNIPLPAKYNLVTLSEDIKTVQEKDYIGAVGALSYFMMGTRTDIAYAVNLLARNSAKPGL